MSDIQISMSKLRQNLGSLVNQAAYGGERIVLMAHGEPKAAIIGIEDLQRLQQLDDNFTSEQAQHFEAVAADLYEQVRELQVAYSVEPEGDVMTLERDKRKEISAVERLRLAKLLLDSVLVAPSDDEREWSALGLSAFEKAWDNPDDAIYDDWRNHYDVTTG